MLLWARLVVESLHSSQKTPELTGLKISLRSSPCQEVQYLRPFAVSSRHIHYPGHYSSFFSDTRRLDWVKQREPPSVSIVIHELDITRLTSPPRVDGIFVCYDSADPSSFVPIPDFLRKSNAIVSFPILVSHSSFPGLIQPLKYSIIAVALKSDLPVAVDPQTSLNLFRQHDVGLVQVNRVGDVGKMRKAFKFLLISIIRLPSECIDVILKLHSKSIAFADADLRNPASPDALVSPLSFERRGSTSGTPTVSSSVPSVRTMSQASSFRLSPTSTLPSSPPPLATSPTRARSTSDLFSEHEKARSRTSSERKLSNTRSVTSLVASNSLQSPAVSSPQPVKGDTLNGLEDDDRHLTKEKEP